jgi:hypothetical protein
MTRRQYSLAIERKEVDDDYHNHFLSHFGFYDEQPSDYGFNKYYSTPYDIQAGSKT